MEVKYSMTDLRLAFLQLTTNKKFERILRNEKKREKIKKSIEEKIGINLPCSQKSELNKKIAEHHGITVRDLVQSKNYVLLCNEFYRFFFDNAAEELIKQLKITDAEAWALICLAQNENFFD